MRLLLADDHPLLLDGLRSVLTDLPDVVLFPSVHNGHQLIDFLYKNAVDVVLMDLNMPKIDGFSALKIISKDFPQVKVIVFTSYGQPQFMREAQALGASGFLLKTADAAIIKKAVSAVSAGETWFPEIKEEIAQPAALSDGFAVKYQLTARELEIIKLVAQGLTTKQISEKLSISEFTINAHRRNISRKTGIDTPLGLLHFAQEQGLL
ncbi:response regulator [Runella sp.]|uniref:response regulator n=1 Tax=Runella sp. TaxID=1960881 RepID=UPI003D0F5192